MVFGDLKKCWRDRCGLDLDENLGYGRVASTVEYTAYILIVFSEELSLERLCKTSLSNGVSEVVRDNTLMPRMMRSLIREKNRKIKPSGKVSRKKKMTLSSRECFQLLSLYKNQEMSYKAAGGVLSTILYWHDVKEAPASELNNLLIDHMYQFSEEEDEDWNEATEPIRWLLFEHVDIAHLEMDTVVLLGQLDFLLHIIKLVKDETPALVIRTMVKEYCMNTAKDNRNSIKDRTCSAQSSLWKGCSMKTAKNNRNGVKVSTGSAQSSLICEAVGAVICNLTHGHGWEAIKSTVQACFARFWKDFQESNPEMLINRAVALEIIRYQVPDYDIDTLCKGIAEEFVGLLETMEDADALFCEVSVAALLEFGCPDHLRRVEK